jgi:SAM-dependent methyltransferase
VVVGLDGCPEFVVMARAVSGCEVWQQDMLTMTLPPASFDGVFANAVLFHLPSLALPGVLDQLHAVLKPGGVLLACNPRGQDEEGFLNGRYACFYSFKIWRRLVSHSGFALVDHYFRSPGKPCLQQPWLATLWRKSTSFDQCDVAEAGASAPRELFGPPPQGRPESSPAAGRPGVRPNRPWGEPGATPAIVRTEARILTKLRTSGFLRFRRSSATGNANCEPGFAPCR